MDKRSGRVLDLRLRGCWFEPHRKQCVAILCLVLVQPKKTGKRPDMTEKLLTGTHTKSIKICSTGLSKTSGVLALIGATLLLLYSCMYMYSKENYIYIAKF